jgi:hypothetical protein
MIRQRYYNNETTTNMSEDEQRSAATFEKLLEMCNLIPASRLGLKTRPSTKGKNADDSCPNKKGPFEEPALMGITSKQVTLLHWRLATKYCAERRFGREPIECGRVHHPVGGQGRSTSLGASKLHSMHAQSKEKLYSRHDGSPVL